MGDQRTITKLGSGGTGQEPRTWTHSFGMGFTAAFLERTLFSSGSIGGNRLQMWAFPYGWVLQLPVSP